MDGHSAHTEWKPEGAGGLGHDCTSRQGMHTVVVRRFLRIQREEEGTVRSWEALGRFMNISAL